MSSYLSSLVDYLSRSFFATRPAVAALSKTSPKVVVHTGEKLFKVVCHSFLKDNRISAISECFQVGGHDWAVCYYPNGDCSVVNGQFASVSLMLMSDCECEVRTSFTFSLQGPASPAPTGKEKKEHDFTRNFRSKGSGWSEPKFVRKDDLTALGYLKDDCIVIKCSLEVIDNHDKEDDIIVPPSSLNNDLRNLFERGHKADLTIKVGSCRSFKVHGCMLAARSPVFRAQLCGSMMETKQNSINIDDMDADVFEALLYYIYNDSLPEFMDGETEEATNMAQHLLVAADRYALERLKLIWESKLSKAIDFNTVGSILDLAEQYYCHHLKAHGLKYIEMNAERLRTIEKTQGFAQLKHNHPLLARDILAMAPQSKKKKKKRKNRNTGQNK